MIEKSFPECCENRICAATPKRNPAIADLTFPLSQSWLIFIIGKVSLNTSGVPSRVATYFERIIDMKAENANGSFTELGMPTHQQLVVPIVKAVNRLGGSAKVSEMAEEVLDLVPNSEELVLATYPNRPNDSVLIERIGWGRATAKRIGVLEQPDRGMYLLTDAGEQLLKLSDDLAYERVRELDREAYRAKRKLKKKRRMAFPRRKKTMFLIRRF